MAPRRLPARADEQAPAMPSPTLAPHPSRDLTLLALGPLWAAGVALTQPRYAVTALGAFAPPDVNAQGDVLGRVGGRPATYQDGAVPLMPALGYGGSPDRWRDATPGVSGGSVTMPTTGIPAAAPWDA